MPYTKNNHAMLSDLQFVADCLSYHLQPSSLLHVRLSRWYKKSRCRPSTLKEAMKADLYFAPPGFDFSAYTLLIIRMFENYRQRLHVAQSKVKTLVPWGSPVVCGKMQGKTLDVQLPGKASTFLGERSSAFVRGTPREGKLFLIGCY